MQDNCTRYMSYLFLKMNSYFSVPPSRLRLTPSAQFPVVDDTLVSFNCTSERVYPNPIFEWYKNDKLIQRFVLSFLLKEKKKQQIFLLLVQSAIKQVRYSFQVHLF